MRLSDVWSGKEDVLEVAAYAAHLPRGGAVGEWFGDQMAVTSETEGLWELSYILAQVNSKKKIKPRKMPEGVKAQKQRADKRSEMMRKWRRKYG